MGGGLMSLCLLQTIQIKRGPPPLILDNGLMKRIRPNGGGRSDLSSLLPEKTFSAELAYHWNGQSKLTKWPASVSS